MKDPFVSLYFYEELVPFIEDLDIDLQHKQCSVTHNLVHSSGLAYQAQIAFETLLVDKGLVHPFLRLNLPNAAYN